MDRDLAVLEDAIGRSAEGGGNDMDVDVGLFGQQPGEMLADLFGPARGHAVGGIRSDKG